MKKLTEPAAGNSMVAQELSQKRDYSGAEDGGPIRAVWTAAPDYRAMTEYIRLWPGKLAAFVDQRLADDDLRPFARGLYEYLCQADGDGPAFEAWRNT